MRDSGYVWVGLFLGVPLAFFARAGNLPKRTATQLLRPIAQLKLVSAVFATVAGLGAFVAASEGWIWIKEPWASRIPVEKHVLFLVDLWAHNASYASGSVGGLIVMALVWRGRRLEGSVMRLSNTKTVSQRDFDSDG